MATLASSTMRALGDDFEDEFPSAVLSGIVGDAAHTTKPGKHLSYQDNNAKWPGSWPIISPKDRDSDAPRNVSGAIDITMSRVDQNKVHNNLVRLFNNRSTDPRAKYIYGFNGWNGTGSPYRYNLYTGATGVTDDSHKWHEHIELYYLYANSEAARKAVMSVVTGETVEQYLGEDMPTPEEYAAAVWAYKPNEDWPNMRVQIMNLFQQLSGKVGNLPGNQNHFPDWRLSHDTGIQLSATNQTKAGVEAARAEVASVKADLATVLANLAVIAGKDYVDETAVAEAVLAQIATKDVADAADALKAVFTPEQIAALKAAL